MKIGVLSDTHNNLTNLEAALNVLRAEAVTTLIHCGDLTSPQTAAALGGFRVIHVLGNGDYASGEIRRVLLELNPLNYSGLVFTGELDGIPIAAVHGHLPREIDLLSFSNQYRYIFHGHSHRRRDEMSGTARLINPGALGGLRAEERSACILDLESGLLRFIY